MGVVVEGELEWERQWDGMEWNGSRLAERCRPRIRRTEMNPPGIEGEGRAMDKGESEGAAAIWQATLWSRFGLGSWGAWPVFDSIPGHFCMDCQWIGREFGLGRESLDVQ